MTYEPKNAKMRRLFRPGETNKIMIWEGKGGQTAGRSVLDVVGEEKGRARGRSKYAVN
jgi:hypothetical protein